jgi:phosphoribosylamine--glycine ligase
MIDQRTETDSGIKVLEYNVRFGDPETQSLMARLESDFIEVLLALHERRLSEISLEWSEKPAVSIVLASGGYPDEFIKGFEIEYPSYTTEIAADTLAFFGGAVEVAGKPVTNGGRVLTVTATGETLAEARKAAYEGAKLIRFSNKYSRTDIAEF